MSDDEYILTEEAIKAIKKIFNEYDLNENGTIEKNELNNLCRALGDPLTKSEFSLPPLPPQKNPGTF